MTLEKADNITECPSIESVWHNERILNNQTTRWGNVLLSHSDTGPYIHIMCPEGSHVVGPNLITCLKGGVWSDVTEPTCSYSSLYGLPESDLVLIGVLAGSGAIVIITLTIIIANMLCYRRGFNSDTSSVERLDRLSGTYPCTPLHADDTHISTVSAPKYPTLNGRHFLSTDTASYPTSFHGNSFYDNSSLSNFTLPRYYLQSATEPYYVGQIRDTESGSDIYSTAHAQNQRNETEEMTYTNRGFRDEYPIDYAHNWENEMRVLDSHEPAPDLGRMDTYSSLDRTML